MVSGSLITGRLYEVTPTSYEFPSMYMQGHWYDGLNAPFEGPEQLKWLVFVAFVSVCFCALASRISHSVFSRTIRVYDKLKPKHQLSDRNNVSCVIVSSLAGSLGLWWQLSMSQRGTSLEDIELMDQLKYPTRSTTWELLSSNYVPLTYEQDVDGARLVQVALAGLTGYLLHDTWSSRAEWFTYVGFEYFVHHLMVLFVLAVPIFERDLLIPSPGWMITELSNIPLACFTWANHFQAPSDVIMLCALAFLAAFTLCRVMWMPYITYMLWWHPILNQPNPIVVALSWTLLTINMLQFYWFMKLLYNFYLKLSGTGGDITSSKKTE